MKLLSWNVNGIRAVAKKGSLEWINNLDFDAFCFQETKAQAHQVEEVFFGTGMEKSIVANEAERKGYSGTAIISKSQVISTHLGINNEEHDTEGRVITNEFESFFLITVYTPNSGNGLARLPYREDWDKSFAAYVSGLMERKPVIICGDLNVCHQEIDIARPKPNYNKSAGYTQKEIDRLDHLLALGLEDSFRKLHPEEVKYSWWSYRAGAREKNIGWRLDYFLVDKRLSDSIVSAEILTDVLGSDHCPILLELDI